MKQKIKVLIIVGSLGIGGNEIFVMNILRSIDFERFSIDLMIYDRTRLEFYDEAIGYGCKVFACSKSANLVGKMIEIYQCIKKNETYQTVHVNSCSFKGLLMGTIPAKLAGIQNIIAHSHNSGKLKKNDADNMFRLFLKFLLENSIDVGLSCSDLAGKSKFREKFMSSERYHVVHNAININQYRYNSDCRTKIREIYHIEDKIIIGNVGRLSKQKNQKFLIEILPDLIKINQRFFLMIIGGGELEHELKNMVYERKLENYVLFTGSVTNVNEFYSAMDVFVMPSHFEGFPFTVIEAQTNGLKCVLSDQITQMANISGDVVFLSLDNKKDWKEKISEFSNFRSETAKIKNVIDQYDLKKEIKIIEGYYQQ